MRLRNVRGSRETIAADECVLHDSEDQKAQKGHWHELFGNDHPIHIEVGMGKGQFIMTLAQQNPDINYIGIEKYSVSLYVRWRSTIHMTQTIFSSFVWMRKISWMCSTRMK